jgi:hypothetical protein
MKVRNKLYFARESQSIHDGKTGDGNSGIGKPGNI